MPEVTARRRTEQQRRALTLLLANLCAIVALLAATGPLAAQDEPSFAVKTRSNEAIVRCDPSTLHAFVGTTVSVTIYVQDVVDLYGLDVRLMFDPAFVQVVDADPGDCRCSDPTAERLPFTRFCRQTVSRQHHRFGPLCGNASGAQPTGERLRRGGAHRSARCPARRDQCALYPG